MTTADQMRNRADELDRIADGLRWIAPHAARRNEAIARELRELAAHLPPEGAPS